MPRRGLLVFLLGYGTSGGSWPFLFLLASGFASFGFAGMALVGAVKGTKLSGSRRGLVAVLALSVLSVFALAIYALIESIDSAFR